MGGSLQGGRGGRRIGQRRSYQAMSEINVTPMVDVMLVLLVIFMVTAPLLTVGVEVDLPKTKASTIQGQDEPISVSVDKDGKIFIQDTQIDLVGLGPRLIAVTNNNPDVRIFVRGDREINYGRVMAVMGAVNQAGFRKVAMVAQLPKKKGQKGK